MNKKIIAIGIVLLIILSFAFIKYRSARNAPADEQLNTCTSAPTEYLSQCEQKVAWLDKKLADWKPIIYKTMNFGVYHVYASDDMFVKTNSDIDAKMLEAIEEVNPGTVVLYIRPESYFSQKERYDALIDEIRKGNKKIFISARFDDKKMSFKDYENALKDYTENIIAVIKPNYYGIVIEPVTMESKHSFNASDEEWSTVVKRTSEMSKQLSPNTKTVAAGHKEELSFLRTVSDIKSLDIVGFDIYGIDGISPDYSGYLGKGDVVGNAIDYANSKGKETWIMETWTSAMNNDQQKAMSIKEFMQPIDAKWIQLMVYYAQKHKMGAIVPFYTGKFVYYGFDQNEFVSALNNKERTPAFYAYKNAISEFNQ